MYPVRARWSRLLSSWFDRNSGRRTRHRFHFTRTSQHRIAAQERLEDRTLLTTFTVADDGSAAFTSIQAAVDAAALDANPDADIVQVAAGNYAETVTVNVAGLTLTGAQAGVDPTVVGGRTGAESIVTGGPGEMAGFFINANNVTLDGFTIANVTAGPGVSQSGGFSGGQIRNNIIRDNVFGLYLNSNGANSTVVEQNLFVDNNVAGAASGNAIYSDQGLSNTLIRDNRFTGDNFNGALTVVGTAGGGGPVTNIAVTGNSIEDGVTINLFDVDNSIIGGPNPGDGNTFSGSAAAGTYGATFTAIGIAGGNDNLTVQGNTFTDRGWRAVVALDSIGTPNTNLTVTDNIINQDLSLLELGSGDGLAIIDLRDVQGPSSVSNNVFNFSNDPPTGATVQAIRVTGANTSNVTVADNNLNGSADVIATGTAANDLYEISAAGIFLNGMKVAEIIAGQSIEINGGDGNDTFVVDYRNGFFDPFIAIDGEGQGVGGTGDVLSVIGDGVTTFGIYTPDAGTPGSGEVLVGSSLGGLASILFTGLEPVDMSGMTTATVLLPNVGDNITIANGTGATLASAAQPAIVVSGTSGGVAIESIHLFDNDRVEILSAFGAMGTDIYTISGADGVASGNDNLLIDTGSDAGDVVNITGAVVLPTTGLDVGTFEVATTTINLNAPITAQTISGSALFGSASTVNVLSNAASIQDAIDLAGDGATVNVAAGTFAETVTLFQAVTLLGAGSGTNPAVDTILNAMGFADGFTVTAGSAAAIAVRNLRVSGASANAVRAASGSNVHLELTNVTTTSIATGLRVDAGATVAATGSIGGLSVAGTFGAGDGAGAFSGGSTSFANLSTFEVEIGGTAPGTGYDQLTVSDLALIGAVVLDVSAINAFSPTAGNRFTIVNNTGANAVAGTFSDAMGNPIADGDAVTIGGVDYFLSYFGGNGNDVTLSVVNDFNTPIVVTGDANNNLIEVRLNAGGGTLQVFVDGVLTVSQAAGSVAELVLNGGDGNDTFVVDYRNGFFDPFIAIDGEGQGVGGTGDVLSVIGDGVTTFGIYTPDAGTPGSGEVLVGSSLGGLASILFTGLEPVDMSGMTTATVLLPNVGDNITIANGTGATLASAAQPAIVVSGTSGGVAIESIHLFDNDRVEILSAFGAMGTDIYTISGADGVASGNDNLLIDTGSDAGDVVNITGAVVLPTTGLDVGTFEVATTTINLNAPITAQTISGSALFGSASTVNVLSNAASIQDAIDLAGDGATVNVAAGTFAETVTVDKSLSLLGAQAAVPGINLGRIFGGAAETTVTAPASGANAALMTVTADDVTIAGFSLNVNRPFASVGVNAQSSLGAFDNLVVQNNIIRTTGGPGAEAPFAGGPTVRAAGIYVRGDGTPIENVTIQGNQIDVTSGGDFFSRGIFLREVQATIGGATANLGNDIHGIGNDLLFQFPSLATDGTSLIQNNVFHGPFSIDVTEPNGGSNVEIRNNVFNLDTTDPLAPFSRAVLIKNNYSATATVLVDTNVFTNYANSVFVGASGNTTISNNTFNAAAGATDFRHIEVNSGVPGTNITIPATYDVTITGNDFNGSTNAATTGIGIAFFNSKTAPGTGFGPIVLGGAGTLANAFEGEYGFFLYLDDPADARRTTAATLSNAAPFSMDLDASQNRYEVASGPKLPTDMTTAELFEVERKIFHQTDEPALGFVTIVAATRFVESTTASGTTPTATDNDYTRINNAIQNAADGDTILLSGTFDWTEANAAASWAAGSDGLAGNGDDYSILVPDGLDNLTITSTMLGSATIQGPGDLPGVDLEGVFAFIDGTNQNIEISNLELLDFDLGIGFFFAGGTPSYDGLSLLNNRIRVAADGSDGLQNIGIHLSFGANQTVQNNQIELPFVANSVMVGLQTNSFGLGTPAGPSNPVDNLLIDGNTITVSGTGTPTRVLGIWENFAAGGSDITVSNNIFQNTGPTNPVTNNQTAFRIASQSSSAGTVTFSGNTATGANTGFLFVDDALVDPTGFAPVVFTGNTLTNVFTGLLVQNNYNAALTGGNSFTGTGAVGSAGVLVLSGSAALSGANTVANFDRGVRFTGGGGTVTGVTFSGTTFDVEVEASSGSDVIDISSTAVTVDTGNRVVSIDGTVRTLRVAGLAGADTFNVSPSMTATITVDGDAPTTAPGDVLNFFVPAGQSASNVPNITPGSGTINTTGGFRQVRYQEIEEVNLDSPTARDDSYTLDEDGTISVPVPGILANDSDIDSANLTVELLGGPFFAQNFNLNPDGSFSYTPNANFNGQDFFRYRVSDGNSFSNTATVFLNVTAIPDAPVAVNDTFTVNEDGTLNVSGPGVLGNDSDADNQPLTAQLVSGPASGTLIFNNNGSFTYTPVPNLSGPVTFTYRATDTTTLQSNVATVTINVLPVNDPPTTGPQAVMTPEDTAVTVTIQASDVDGNPLTYTVIVPPGRGTVVNNGGGSFTYTPNADYNGPDSFTVRVSDGNGGFADSVVSLSVTPVNDFPIARNDSFTVNEDGVLTVAAPGVLSNDSDPDGGSLTASLVSQPTKGTLQFNSTGGFIYTPNANANGADSFTYRVTDSTGLTAIATVSISITPVVDPPIARNDAATTMEDAAVTINVLANDTSIDGPASVTRINGMAIAPGGTVTLANGSTVRLNANGTLTYTPGKSFRSLRTGQSASDSFTYTLSDGTGGLSTATVNLTLRGATRQLTAFARSVDPTQDPGTVQDQVEVQDETGAVIFSFDAFPEYSGGVRLAIGDVNGDGTPDIIAGTGPTTAPMVRVFSGIDGSLLAIINLSDTFNGGVFVAAGDLTGNGAAEVIISADAGSTPRVMVFSLANTINGGGNVPGANDLVADFLAYGAGFRGGVRVAAGDVNGDGRADIITGNGVGAAADVRVINGRALVDQYAAMPRTYTPFEVSRLLVLRPYSPAFTGGVFVAAGNITGDFKAEVIVAQDFTRSMATFTPQVLAYNSTGAIVANFAAFPNCQGGVRLAVGDANLDGVNEIIASAGPAMRTDVRSFTPAGGLLKLEMPIEPTYTGGLHVASGRAVNPLVVPSAPAVLASRSFDKLFAGGIADELLATTI